MSTFSFLLSPPLLAVGQAWLLPTVGWLIFVFWVIFLAPMGETLCRRWLRRRTDRVPAPAAWPSLSVIIPARDEGPNIEETLRTVLKSNYPQLRVIAVNDRSTDETGSIMDRIALEDGRLEVIHVRELPSGWLGKNHALHAGTQQAQSDLILFTDGDIVFDPEAIRRAVLYLEARQIDHLCLAPEFIPGSVWENSINTFFAMIFISAVHPWLIPTSFKRAYAGVGAFNLIRTSVYNALGGHKTICLDVLDDVDLGKMVKYEGYRQDFLLAGDLIRVRWQTSFWNVIRGLEKNGFASLRYSVPALVLVTFGMLVLVICPYVVALATHDVRAVPFLATVVLLHVVYGIIGLRFKFGPWVMPLLPFATLIFLFAFWRSAIITLRRGGVRWRDTFYPLEVLRANLYR